MSQPPSLDGFNQQGIYQALANLSLPDEPSFLKSLRPRFDIRMFDQVASTNETLWNMADARAGTVTIAHRQTAGKGQRGKQWLSPPGGIYLSLMVEPDWAADRSAQLTMASAWGIVSQFRHLGVPAQIKWPNDIVVNGQKLGGILSEGKLEQGIITRAVIGVGINVYNPVPATGITWQTLMGAGHKNSSATLHQVSAAYKTPSTATLCQVSAAALLGIWHGIFYRNHINNQTFTDSYQSLLNHLNQPVILKGKTWTIVGVTDAGHLTLSSTSKGSDLTNGPVEQLVHLKQGEVSLGYPQSGSDINFD